MQSKMRASGSVELGESKVKGDLAILDIFALILFI